VTGSEPPPIPRDAPPAPAARSGGLSTKAIILIVAGVLALPVCAGLVTAVAIMVPKMQETARRTTCMSHLSGLTGFYLSDAMADRARAQRWSGSSLWLAMRRQGTPVLRGQEKTLLCPGDVMVRLPETESERSAWDNVDLEHPPRELCSYAGRDFAAFPIDPAERGPHPIGACIHHRGGAVVAFDDGSCQFMTKEDLGLEHDDEMVVGPESASPVLSVLRGGD
jgi:hypothetical protein